MRFTDVQKEDAHALAQEIRILVQNGLVTYAEHARFYDALDELERRSIEHEKAKGVKLDRSGDEKAGSSAIPG